MNTALIWLEAARPKTLILSVTPVIIGTSYAYYHGAFSIIPLLMTLITALCIQIGTNFANDYYDCLKGADTSTRIGPRRMTQAGLISLSKMKLATFLTFSCVALLSFYLTARGGPVFTLLTTLSIACGILYTGGPKPLAYLGLGELFVLFFFGPIATAGAAYLQTLTFSWEAVVLGFTPGLLSTAVLVINNLRDIDNDRRAGKKTLAVRYGKRFTQYEYTFLVIAGCLLPLIYGWWLTALSLIPALIPLKAVWRPAPDSDYQAAFGQTALIGLLTALLIAFGLIVYAP
jgi:1,4-dihydroxy-2-naphthoate octaprenyltransferase